MHSGIKLQFAMVAASGLTVVILAAGLAVFAEHLTAARMRYLLPIPPLSVAAYSFVLGFVRDGTEELPGLAESAFAVGQATLVAALLFGFMSGAILLFTRLGARFL